MMTYGPIAGVPTPVSRLILGGLFFSDETRATANRMLDRFVAAGGTAIDTAHAYGQGQSERGLGRWLRAHGTRDRLTIITKGAHPYPPDEPYRVSSAHIDRDLPESLERLGLEQVDLYLLHRDDERVTVASLIECLTRHIRDGQIRAYGASNWTTDRITAANVYATSRNVVGFAASSPNLALATPREPIWPGCLSIADDEDALAWHRQHQFPALCWSSQARGFFASQGGRDQVSDSDLARVYDTTTNWARLERARHLAERYGSTPTQVALAWVLGQDFPTFALIGPRSVAELDDSLGALDLQLSAEELRWLHDGD
jgi:aryl-alcohol dehydrogenase-like predicted oxidoreductase